VFSFQDDDEQWISLRYDLTAPLARYVAERYGTENLVCPTAVIGSATSIATKTGPDASAIHAV